MGAACREIRELARMMIRPKPVMQRGDKIVLAGILMLAAVLRLIGINAGLPLAWNGDETFVMDHALAIGNDLNPHAFVYGGLTFYLPRTVTWAASFIASRLPGVSWTFSDDYLAARLIAAGFGTGTVACAFEIGRQLAGTRAGLFGALVFAGSPLAVNLAHYFTADPQMGFWSALSLVAMTRWLYGSDRASSLAGVALGLAIGSKYSAAVMLVPMAVIAFQRNRSRPDSLSSNRRLVFLAATAASLLLFLAVLFFQNQILNLAATWTNSGQLKSVYVQIFQRLIFIGALAAGMFIVLGIGVAKNTSWGLRVAPFLTSSDLLKPVLLALVTFLVVAPFTLLDLPSFAQGFFYVLTWQILGNKAALSIDSRDFRALDPDPVRSDPFFYIRGIQQEWGWLVFAFILVGVFMMWKKARPAFIPFIGTTALALFALSFGAYQPLRYLYPFWPLFTALGGMGANFVVEGLHPRFPQPQLVTGAMSLLLLGSLGAPMLVVESNYFKPDTRNQALEWVQKNVPSGCPILRESDTPEIERVDAKYKVKVVDTAFEQTTLDEWQKRGICLIMIGTQRYDLYAEHENDFRDVLAQYADLKKGWSLVASFDPSAEVKGPAIRVFMPPQ
jgi:4-amino-4-deoxy-L-arabinose transferase-like glycosyltransferase